MHRRNYRRLHHPRRLFRPLEDCITQYKTLDVDKGWFTLLLFRAVSTSAFCGTKIIKGHLRFCAVVDFSCSTSFGAHSSTARCIQQQANRLIIALRMRHRPSAVAIATGSQPMDAPANGSHGYRNKQRYISERCG